MSPVPERGRQQSHMHERLRSQWDSLCRDFTDDAVVIDEVLTDLVQRYAENGRSYHTLAHVDAVLQVLHVLQSHPSPALLFAAWFHDVVYNPLRDDNEARSAEHAAAQLAKLHVPNGVIERVQQLIMVTQSHQPNLEDAEGMVLVDADLAILGAETAVYEHYARAIRDEYAHVPDIAYRHGRQQVLRRFLARPEIYRTKDAARLYETRARANLRREMQRLAY